jgi:hypothetical protein
MTCDKNPTRSGFSGKISTKIAVKVINHYGDEVLKVYEILVPSIGSPRPSRRNPVAFPDVRHDDRLR